MATNPPGQVSDAIHRRRILSGLRFILAVVLLALLVICLVFSWITRDAMANLPFLKRQANAQDVPSQNAPVDVRPWQTAQALAASAVTAEETEYARDAERLADHEVDQAFASALREATAQPRPVTGEALTLSRKIANLQQIVKQDQAAVQKLTQSSPSKAGRVAPAAPGADDLAIAKAQLGLDSDELADAQRDLARAVGDERATIKQQLAAHEAAMRKYDAQVRNEEPVALASARQDRTVASRLKAWFDQRTRYQLIQQALRQAQADSVALIAQHDRLENKTSAASSTASANSPQSGVNAAPAPDKAAVLAGLMNRTAQRELLGIYDDRIQTEQQLADVYSKWSAQVLLQHRIVLHLLLQSFALIALILLS